MSRRKNKKYSKELRLEAVQAYLNGEGSQAKICKRGSLSIVGVKNQEKKQQADVTKRLLADFFEPF